MKYLRLVDSAIMSQETNLQVCIKKKLIKK